MSLNGAEWKLLHRVMDLVSERRAKPVAGADMGRVKALVMDVYREQGIAVDEAIVEQAIADAAGPGELPGLVQAVDDGRVQSLQRAESRWRAMERTRERVRHAQHLRENPIARIQANIEQRSAPLIAHRPLDDKALGALMARAMVGQLEAFKRLGWLVVGAGMAGIAGLAGFAWQVHLLTGGSGSGLAAWMTMAMVGTGFLAGRRAWQARIVSGAQAMVLLRGQKALALGDYGSDDLKQGAKLAGHQVRGSLKPLGVDKTRAWDRRGRHIAGDDKVVATAWDGWDFSRAPVRENDLLVLQRLKAVRMQHPFHAVKKLKELARERGQEIDDGPW